MGIPFSFAYSPDEGFEYSDRFSKLAEIANIDLYCFTPLEVKALYVIGLLEDIFSSVSCLLQKENAWPKRYLPAFGLFSSSMDLLGRCINGNATNWQKHDLEIGFRYLYSPSKELPSIDTKYNKAEIFRTNHRGYTINDLQDLRNYSLHGQATVKGDLPPFDIEMLDKVPQLMGAAIQIYWDCLKISKEYCERLAKARISVYRDRTDPVASIIVHLQHGKTIASLFNYMDWQVYKK